MNSWIGADPRTGTTNSGSYWIADDCEAGVRLIVEVSESNRAVSPAIDFDHAARFNRFHEAIMANTPVKLDGIGGRAFLAGLGTDIAEYQYENCGCAVFYPELRGDKVPYGDYPEWAKITQPDATGVIQ